jgi:hypothetical protein
MRQMVLEARLVHRERPFAFYVSPYIHEMLCAVTNVEINIGYNNIPIYSNKALKDNRIILVTK